MVLGRDIELFDEYFVRAQRSQGTITFERKWILQRHQPKSEMKKLSPSKGYTRMQKVRLVYECF